MQVVAVRLTAEEPAAVDAIAEREHIARSEAIHRALAGFAACRSTTVHSRTGPSPTTQSKQPTGRCGSSPASPSAFDALSPPLGDRQRTP